MRAAKPLTVDDERHGTRNGYYSYDCRCKPCTAANSAYFRSYRRRTHIEYQDRGPEQIAADRAALRPTGRKRCRWCGKHRAFSAFGIKRSEKDGLARVCRTCEREMPKLMAMAWEHFRQTRAVRGTVWCAYCRERTATQLDHYIPLNRGGTHTLENMVPSCLPCNSSKQDRDPVQWQAENGYTVNEPLSHYEAELLRRAA